MKKKFKVRKKDGKIESFEWKKIYNAVEKSAGRTLVDFTDDMKEELKETISEIISCYKSEEIIDVKELHTFVEKGLGYINEEVARSYKDFRNYKVNAVEMLNKVYKESQRIMYIGDKENSNADSTLVSTKRSLIYGELNKELYKKFFLNNQEQRIIEEGYLYIHDMNARRDSINCCLSRVGEIMKGGFEMGNVWYNEPKGIDVAFDVMSDIISSASAQQYGY